MAKVADPVGGGGVVLRNHPADDDPAVVVHAFQGILEGFASNVLIVDVNTLGGDAAQVLQDGAVLLVVEGGSRPCRQTLRSQQREDRVSWPFDRRVGRLLLRRRRQRWFRRLWAGR